MFEKIKRILIGQKLKNEDLNEEKLNIFWGLPVLSSDAISSVAYAAQEILWVLVPIIGILAYKTIFYIALAIITLLCILVFSYRQTIDSYPCGGGSYIVAKDNIGQFAGLIAGASLSMDYVLTVAVSTSSGTDAIVSAIPSLLNYRVEITLLFIFILAIGNLRGIKDSSRLFGVPTYLFIISCLIMIGTGIFKVAVLKQSPTLVHEIPTATGNITIFLILKAFSGGCTALTGVEAVSNGIPNFKDPAQKNAKKVLALLALIVFLIFGGMSYLASLYHAVPNHEVTVIAQIADQVFGKSFMFYAVQITTALILIMAANTAFSDFPLLLSLISKDGYAPKQLSRRGERLNFANGIKLLSLAAAFLIIAFNGSTHALIPLYAVGVFTSFTLSQSGMCLKWFREKTDGWRHKAFVNGFGALVTLVTVVIISVSKFKDGAWIVCILIPIFVLIMVRIKAHYNTLARELSLSIEREKPLSSTDAPIEHVIVLVDNLNQASLKAINYAKRLSDNVVAFHISVDKDETQKLQDKWNKYNPNIPLITKYSPYRDIVKPLQDFIESEEHASQAGDNVTIVMPQFVVKKWWHNILHTQTAMLLRRKLMMDRHIVLITVPYVV